MSLLRFFTSSYHYSGFLAIRNMLGEQGDGFWRALSFSACGVYCRWSKILYAEAVCTVRVVAAKDHYPLGAAVDFGSSCLFFSNIIYLI